MSNITNKLHSAPQTDESVEIANGDDGAPIILHPLVVLNVSDHYTRYAAIRMYDEDDIAGGRGGKRGLTDEKGNPRVIGLLLGTQRGRIIEVCHSVELTGEVGSGGRVSIDADFMQSRIEQYQQIFAQYTVVGWYSTGTAISTDDLRLHEDVFTVLNETPIFLLMHPKAHQHSSSSHAPAVAQSSTANDNGIANDNDDERMKVENNIHSDNRLQNVTLGHGIHSPGMLTTYQMELKVVDNKPTKFLVQISHRYASEDSERIAVDHVMRHAVPGGGGGTSGTALHLASLRSSIKMLHERLRVIAKFLHATINQEIPVDHELLRQVSSVCARLPALDCIEFSDAFADEENDSLVVSYLGGVTKTMCSLSEALDMFSRFNVRVPSTGPPRRRSAFSRS